MIWTEDELIDRIYETETAEDKKCRETFVNEVTSHMVEEEEFDCPIHGKLGGINECPRC